MNKTIAMVVAGLVLSGCATALPQPQVDTVAPTLGNNDISSNAAPTVSKEVDSRVNRDAGLSLTFPDDETTPKIYQ